MLDNFKTNNIIFFFFYNLNSYNKINIGLIYYIPNLFLFKYGLYKIDLLKLIFKVIKFLFLIFMVVIFIHHFDNNLEKNKKYNTSAIKHILNFII